jgi:hypothetical protein
MVCQGLRRRRVRDLLGGLVRASSEILVDDDGALVRNYARIAPRFWIGTTGRRLRGAPEAQVMAAYLMTAPTSTMTGLFYMPIAVAAHETGIPIEGASKALRRVCEVGFALYDEVDEVVFVPEMARHQIDDALKPGDKRVQGVVNALDPYVRHPFCQLFLEKYSKAFNLPDDIFQGSSMPLPRPFHAPSETPRSQDQDQDQDQEQEQEKVARARARTRRAPSGEHQTFIARFEELFAAKNLGARPSWGGKQGALVKTLLKRPGGLAEALRRAENMFAAPPPFPPPPHDLATLVQHFDRFAQPYRRDASVGHYQHTGDEEYAGGEVDF